MPLRPERPGKTHDETAHVVQHYQSAVKRVLDFLGYTIDDVVNDREKREHVRRACLLSLRIQRDLAEEPWRSEATARLGRRLEARLGEWARESGG